MRQSWSRSGTSMRASLPGSCGMEILEASEGYSRVTMDCAGKMNPGGVAHGGAIFALADQAFGIAANCCGTHRVAVSVSIQYIAPAKGKLVAVAERIDDNGSCDTYRVMVHEGERTDRGIYRCRIPGLILCRRHPLCFQLSVISQKNSPGNIYPSLPPIFPHDTGTERRNGCCRPHGPCRTDCPERKRDRHPGYPGAGKEGL